MDDALNQNTSQNYTVESPYGPNTPASSATAIASSTAVVYASFFQRFVAALVDGLLVGIVTGIISKLFGMMGDIGTTLGSLVAMALSFLYYVYFISSKGQTIGKKAMGLRVQDEMTGQNLTVVSAILREVIGKAISGIVLLLGYLWMLWDPKKQTWHDKIAKSVVVKVK